MRTHILDVGCSNFCVVSTYGTHTSVLTASFGCNYNSFELGNPLLLKFAVHYEFCLSVSLLAEAKADYLPLFLC